MTSIISVQEANGNSTMMNSMVTEQEINGRMIWSTWATELKCIADTLKDIMTECWFTFGPDTISLVNVDPEKVALVNMQLRPDKSKYKCIDTFHFPIYVQTLYKVMRGSKNGDNAILRLQDSNTLTIQIYDSSQKWKSVVSLSSLNNTKPEWNFPAVFYDREVLFNSDKLYYILHDLSAISRVFKLTYCPQVLYLESEDSTGTSLKFAQPHSSQNLQYSASFLIKYLEKFLKPRLTKVVALRIKRGEPLSVVYMMDHGFLELTTAELV